MNSSVRYVVGVDETGCGTLVGPLIVCAAAFSIEAERVTTLWHGVLKHKVLLAGDSKGIKNAGHRAVLETAIRATSPSVAVIEKSSAEIDQRLLGVVLPEAIHLAAARCIERLKVFDATLEPPHVLVLIDGNVVRPDLMCQVECIPNGDKTDWRIGAASIVARAVHDRRIDALHAEYPRWGFDKSRGYPTKEHKALLAARGPTAAHRKSYRAVQEVMPPVFGIER